MLHDSQIEFHNVAELITDTAGDGRLLQRMPEALRHVLNPTARIAACSPTHCELRYVSAASSVEITLHSEIHHEYLRIYQGDHFQQEFCLEPNQTRTFELHCDPRLIQHTALSSGFSPEVMRLRLSGTGRVRFLSVEANGSALRPPTAAEKPALTMLAYGSSITQGFSSGRLATAFLAQTADRLGVDFINLGFGGSCQCETEIGDHLAARQDWQIALLELGINMLGIDPPISDDQFRELACNMLEKTSRDPTRLVVAITLFPGDHDLPDAPRAAEPWRQILRELVADLARPNLRLVEGSDLLDWNGLTTDLCHPCDHGHAMIAERLSARLESILNLHPDFL
ncbi:MAG: GDSL-type esterase/lipase family protein [Luteolibacter sp.]